MSSSGVATNNVDVGRFCKGEFELYILRRPRFRKRDADLSAVVQTLLGFAQLNTITMRQGERL